MSDVIRWLLAVEIISAAFLPLTAWFLRSLPDRGYAFARVIGLLGITYLTWVVGLALPVTSSGLVPALFLLLVGVTGWWFLRGDIVTFARQHARLLAAEEGLFLAGLIGWSLLRVYVFHPAAGHTEQFMDLSFLSASMHSASYPPYDPWMSGHSINYYYLGYLMMGTLAKLAGVSAGVAYNLSLSQIMAAGLAGSFSIGYALTRRLRWALLAPLFVALLGNWHALLWQLPHLGCAGFPTPDFWSYLWPSSRVVGGGFTLSNWACPASPSSNPLVIDEYPLFSLVLGDLHPHVMALPVALLAVASTVCCLFAPAWSRARVALSAVVIGSLYAVNSWDFPTYFLVMAAVLFARAYITDDSRSWWRPAVLSSVGLGVLSVALYSPFYLGFKAVTHGIGPVTTPSDLFEIIQVFGLFFLTGGLLVATLNALLRPAEEEVATELPKQQPAAFGSAGGIGQAATVELIVSVVAIIVLGGVMHRWVLLALLAFLWWTLQALHKVLNTEEPNRADALALILVAVGLAVLCGTELVYIRDAFDNGLQYRMNTVFKFYYQAWVLLGLAGAYGAWRSWKILQHHFAAAVARAALLAVALGVGGAAIYTLLIPTYTDAAASYGQTTLDATSWWSVLHPDDWAAIEWLREHAAGNPTVLEATGNDYLNYARVAAFTGLPTVLGWAGHEEQWRPGDPEIAVRSADIKTIYTTRNPSLARSLLDRYHVRYVIVGEMEHEAYGALVHPAFASFLRVVFHQGNTAIYGR